MKPRDIFDPTVGLDEAYRRLNDPKPWEQSAHKTNGNKADAIVTPLKARFTLIRFADLKMSASPSALIRGLIPRVGLAIV